MVNSNKIKEIRNSIYSGSFDPYSSYRSGQSLVESLFPSEEVGIGGLVRNPDPRINSMSFDNRASFEVGKTIHDFYNLIKTCSFRILDGVSKAVKDVYEQLYFNRKE